MTFLSFTLTIALVIYGTYIIDKVTSLFKFEKTFLQKIFVAFLFGATTQNFIIVPIQGKLINTCAVYKTFLCVSMISFVDVVLLPNKQYPIIFVKQVAPTAATLLQLFCAVINLITCTTVIAGYRLSGCFIIH